MSTGTTELLGHEEDSAQETGLVAQIFPALGGGVILGMALEEEETALARRLAGEHVDEVHEGAARRDAGLVVEVVVA